MADAGGKGGKRGDGGLVGGSLLVKQEEGEGGGLVVRVEGEDCVEAAALVLKVARFGGQPEPGADHEERGMSKVSDYELGQECSELSKHEELRGR